MENNDFSLLRLFRDAKKLGNRKESSNEDSTHPAFRMLEETVNSNLEQMKKIQDDPDKPPFMKNFEKDHGKTINSDAEIADPHMGGKSSPEAQEEVQEKKNRPVALLQRHLVKDLAAKMKANVFGQDDVIDEMVSTLKVSALKLKGNKEKPAGCYLLAGPSGCGKTEMALSLAKGLGTEDCPVPLLKLNMGEYGMENDVTKLIGPPPGYKGFEQGGVLTNFVRENPICIVLFDEFEKAHDSIDKILLGLMDKGVCADGKGKEVFFNNTIIISTSNLGAEIEYEENLTKEQKNEYRMEAIKQGMRPEIINRHDSIFQCNALPKDIYEKVLVKNMNKLKVSMKEEHDIELKFTPKLISWASDSSYDPAMGGRPAERFIEKVVVKPIADQMIEGNFDESVKEITLDLNKQNNVVFKNKNKKILGVLENTASLVSKIEDNKFSKRPRI